MAPLPPLGLLLFVIGSLATFTVWVSCHACRRLRKEAAPPSPLLGSRRTEEDGAEDVSMLLMSASPKGDTSNVGIPLASNLPALPLDDSKSGVDPSTSTQLCTPGVKSFYKDFAIALLVSCVVWWILVAVLMAILGAIGGLDMFLFAPQLASDCVASCPVTSPPVECCTFDHANIALHVGSHPSEVWLQGTHPGVSIHGFLFLNKTLATSGHPPLRILYNHGSGGNVASAYRFERYRFLLELGNVELLVYDYPGYGKSEGPTTAVSVAQSGVDAAVSFATGINATNRGAEGRPAPVPTGDINNVSLQSLVLLGRSMGGAVATHIGKTVGGGWSGTSRLILQSAFSNLQDIAAYYFPMYGWILRGFAEDQFSQFDNLKNLIGFDGCLYHVHSKADQWVPFSEAEAIETVTAGRRQSCSEFVVEPSAKHTQHLTEQERTTLSVWLNAHGREVNQK